MRERSHHVPGRFDKIIKFVTYIANLSIDRSVELTADLPGSFLHSKYLVRVHLIKSTNGNFRKNGARVDKTYEFT